ncbi:MAG: hypothetical protein ACRDF8_08090, partial [Chloroflexota bacterium]
MSSAAPRPASASATAGGSANGQHAIAGQVNPYAMALEQFNQVAELLRLEPAVAEILRQPHRELTVHFPVRMDDGSTRVFTGYRVQKKIGRV